jgi:GNAT superfamily N-acetyltransferase
LTARPGLRVRPADPADRDWIERFLARHDSTRVARRAELLAPLDHPMLVALADDRPAGLLTYIIADVECEILTLHVTRQWQGIGTALVEAIGDVARSAGCVQMWVLTTNDNVDALRFYQRRGFRLRALRPGAVDASRRDLKPEISRIGDHGIPLRDELELELDLTESGER